MSSQNIVVTGGAGYIGSHTVLQLLRAGYTVTVLDNLVNSKEEALNRVWKLSELDDSLRSQRLVFHNIDLCDKKGLANIIKPKSSGDENGVSFYACIHFAGLKAVGESCKLPLLYYRNNLIGSFNLVEALANNGCKKLIFSSSATVYGSASVPMREASTCGQGITNPYGRTKYFLEEIFRDVFIADKSWGFVMLRYFNPVGNHPSGIIGEDPQGIPNNLLPYVQQVAVGRREKLTVFGNDYKTKDGTGERDYLHVMDLADGHLAALRRLEGKVGREIGLRKKKSTSENSNNSGTDQDEGGFEVYNLGTGTAFSVLEMVEGMRKASGKPIPYVFGDRRPGDLDTCYADPSAAKQDLEWEAKRTLQEMCNDAWKWQSTNPMGYN
eukprot:g765.t1